MEVPTLHHWASVHPDNPARLYTLSRLRLLGCSLYDECPTAVRPVQHSPIVAQRPALTTDSGSMTTEVPKTIEHALSQPFLGPPSSAVAWLAVSNDLGWRNEHEARAVKDRRDTTRPPVGSKRSASHAEAPKFGALTNVHPAKL